ncbi:UvrD-helicase domain-containing protein [Corynebacterium sp. 4HC-13]|uniref:DNA 3'-5' helicase n=1 Tax=Corynebacterium anserum TaxID=2684406 RepID=A0A7G7YR87_9CORY|nr:UvrD-helicase domain-containing protein [Corynebacterium anserum]QNH97007.1 AAA family ATPase [Corynebacterium anserum]
MSELDPDQLQAATAPRGPVCIIAGAGTGKTRTVTHRIAHLVGGGYVNPDHVLAVTFTSRAATELRERLTMMGVARVQAKTFHAATLRQLSYFWPHYAGDLPWRLLDSKFSVVARAARSLRIDADKTALADIIGEIEWAKSSLVAPDDYPSRIVPDRRDCPLSPEQFVDIFKAYEGIKTTREGILLDFDDLLMHMAAAIESTPGIADEFRSRYRTFVVDEYQDVTPLQQRVLDAWLGERDDLTVVGDANQTIYSFNGATPDYLLDFSRRFPSSVTVRLQRDYRSTPQVVDLANKVIGQAKGRVAGTRLRLIGQRPTGPTPEFAEYTDETAEASAVAKRITQLINEGVDPSEIAILYRINSSSAVFEYALEEAGISYQVKGGEGFFNRQEIIEAHGALMRAAHKYSPESQDVLNAVKAALVPVGLSTEEPTGAKERSRWQSLRALVDLVEELINATPGITFQALVAMLSERREAKNPPRMQSVTLASMHAAKGLEWDAVFLVGLNDGMVPIHYALKGSGADDAIEEERRLLYVGITRARERLYLSWAQARQPGGKSHRQRTRFLDGVVPASRVGGNASPSAVVSAANSRVGAPKNACTVCGTRLSTQELKILGRCGEHVQELDHLLVTELRSWRTAMAQELAIPAYVIMTDATLAAIAAAQPTTAEELVQVAGMGPVKVDRFGEDILAITQNVV